MESLVKQSIRLELITVRFLLIHKYYELIINANYFCAKLSLNIKKFWIFCCKNKIFQLLVIFPLFVLLLSGFIKIHKSVSLEKSKQFLSSNFVPAVGVPSSGIIPLNDSVSFFKNYENIQHLNKVNYEKIEMASDLRLFEAIARPNLQAPMLFQNIKKELLKPEIDFIYNKENLAKISLRERKKIYLNHINKYAKKYKLNPKLLSSIIYAESLFLPHLVSKKNAYGLMQIVPNTAGIEVYKFLKKNGQPGRQELMNPETNIFYGSTYLYLLKSYHLNKVINKKSRELLTIASYNAGSGAVLRHFDPNRKRAIKVINSMDYNEILSSILLKFRSLETRLYVKKVLRHMSG